MPQSGTRLAQLKDYNKIIGFIFKTKISGWVQIAAGVIECVLGVVLAWWGSGRRQFALTGWLGASATAGLLVLAFPFAYSNPANVGRS